MSGVIISTFKRRKFFIIVLFFGLVVYSTAKELYDGYYEAKTVIMIDYKKSPTSAESSYQMAEQVVGAVMVNMQLLKSPEVLRSVVEDLRLYEEVKDFVKFAGFKFDRPKSRENKIRIMQEILDKKLIKVTSAPFTNIINITVRHKKAEVAADAANTLVNNYKKWVVELSHREVDTLIEYLNREVTLAFSKLKESEEELRKFEEKNKIVYLPREMDDYIKKKEGLEEKLQQSQIEEDAVIDQIKLLKNKLNTLTDSKSDKVAKTTYSVTAVNNPIIQAYEEQLMSLKIEMSRLKELYADESIQVRYMQARIIDLEVKIDKTIVQLFKSEFSLATLNPVYEELVMEIMRKETEAVFVKAEKAVIIKSLALHEDKLKSFPQKQMELASLNRQVKYQEEVYFLLLEEQKKAQLLRTKDTREDIKLIAPALVPLKTNFRFIKTLVRWFFAFLFSVFFAFILDLKRLCGAYSGKN
ncbi:MAG: hypothetical protein V1747_09475 [Candidatus Omnitrophota bacterium]